MLTRVITYGERVEKQYLEASILIQGVVLEELLRLLVDDEACCISSDFLIMGGYIDRLLEENRVTKDSVDYCIMEEIRNKRNALVHGKPHSLETIKRNGEWLTDSINSLVVSDKIFNSVNFPIITKKC